MYRNDRQQEDEAERAILSPQVEQLRVHLGLRQIDVSAECGVNASMLSQWMLGRYKGKVGRINRLMSNWLDERRTGKVFSRKNNQTGEFSTPYKRKIAEMLQGKWKEEKRVVNRRKLYAYPKKVPKDCCIVPIYLDLDIDGTRLIDSFLWNTFVDNDTGNELVLDLDLPNTFLLPIAESMHKQVKQQMECAPWHCATKKESLHPILINFRLNDTIVKDQFEWDLSDKRNCPEKFALQLCQDLGLDGEFQAIITILIYKQLGIYSKLYHNGYGNKVTKMQPVHCALRNLKDIESWEPKVLYMKASDVYFSEREDLKNLKSRSARMHHVSPVKPIRDFISDKPPKHINTYLMFCSKWRKAFMTKYPDRNAKEISIMLGERWQQLTLEERSRFEPLAAAENARRLTEWQKEQTQFK